MFQSINKIKSIGAEEVLKNCKNPGQIVYIDHDHKIIENLTFNQTLGQYKEKIEKILREMSFDCKGNEVALVHNSFSDEKRFHIIAIAVSPKKSHLNWQKLGKSIAHSAKKHKLDGIIFPSEIFLDQKILTEKAFEDIMTGFYGSSWNDNRFKSKQDETTNIKLFCDNKKLKDKINKHLIKVEAMLSAKFFGNAPGNTLTTTAFAKYAESLHGQGMHVKILDQKALEKENMSLMLAVGNSSIHPPYLAIMEWAPEGTENDTPLAVVGKGVCFDTGGVNLKPSSAILGMHMDMCGAASVISTMDACKKLKIKKRIIGVLALVENAIGDKAQRPGDIVTARSGKTVSILNTDAEGRLILADAVDYTIDNYKPHTLIDLATLTGAVIMALGSHYAGLFSNDDELVKKISQSGQNTHEKVWRLPLGEEYSNMVKNNFSDIQNLGTPSEAGSITAAAFIQEFIKNETKWAHIDIAGTAMPKSHPIHEKGATGYGPMLLLDFIMTE